MKKLLSFTLIFILVFFLFACGEPPQTVESKVADAVEFEVMFEIMLSYEIVGTPIVTTYIDTIGENEYEVTGKVTVRDKYGDTYTGKYDAIVSYNPETDKCSAQVDIDTLYRD